MMIDVLLILTTLAIAAFAFHALWKARRNESGQLRRVIALAQYGAGAVMLAKFVELLILLTADAANGGLAIVRYSDIAATIVVAGGIALLAISLLDTIMIGRQLWPKEDDALSGRAADPCRLAGCEIEPAAIPAILFRKGALLRDTGVSSVFLNNKAEDLLGFTREELQSDPHFLTWLMHPEDRQDFLAGDERLAEAQSEAIFDHRFKHRSGSYRWIRTIMKRVDDDDGAFREIVGCGLDITDLKEAEEQLASILSTDPCSLLPEDDTI